MHAGHVCHTPDPGLIPGIKGSYPPNINGHSPGNPKYNLDGLGNPQYHMIKETSHSHVLEFNHWAGIMRIAPGPPGITILKTLWWLEEGGSDEYTCQNFEPMHHIKIYVSWRCVFQLSLLESIWKKSCRALEKYNCRFFDC